MVRQKRRAKATLKTKMMKLFEALDHTGDGMLDRAEFETIESQPGPPQLCSDLGPAVLTIGKRVQGSYRPAILTTTFAASKRRGTGLRCLPLHSIN